MKHALIYILIFIGLSVLLIALDMGAGYYNSGEEVGAIIFALAIANAYALGVLMNSRKHDKGESRTAEEVEKEDK